MATPTPPTSAAARRSLPALLALALLPLLACSDESASGIRQDIDGPPVLAPDDLEQRAERPIEAATSCADGALCPSDPTGTDPEHPGLDTCAAADAPEDCCASDADCDDGDPQTVNVCEGASCVATLNPDVCTSDADCDDGDPCTAATCTAGLCGYAGAAGPDCCQAAERALAGFDGGTLSGLFVTDNLETGVFWTPDRTRHTSGPFSLYCGDPVSQTYAFPSRVKSSATTPLLAVPSGGRSAVRLDLFKATRPRSDLDVFQVLVLRDGALVSAWSSREVGVAGTGAFQTIEVPLDAYAGQTIQLRFVFDSVSAPLQAYEGVYIDTIALTTTCGS
ncbi:MAG: hypothetical protein H6744_11460 [Deltaproteobacteria bacterium]|nr:hypothetical protein [Deltaproteobacteria bacterium]MCB9787293.1 hypothetical protein [Deltaproteobacteria bacterium]